MDKFFKVKIGYDKNDFIEIDEDELEKAIKAMGTGQVAIFKRGVIAGNSIISILPDWNRLMGWNRDYSPNGEDYRDIPKGIQNDHRLAIEAVTRKVQGLPPATQHQFSEETKKLADKFGKN